MEHTYKSYKKHSPDIYNWIESKPCNDCNAGFYKCYNCKKCEIWRQKQPIPGDVSDVMFGFKKLKPVKITFAANGNPIHFFQPSTEYEAILIPPPAEDENN